MGRIVVVGMGCVSAKRKRQSPSPVPLPAPILIPEPSPAPSRIIVRTRLKLEDIQSADFTPHNTNRQTFKYSCPICFRYLSAMLITSCCRNYICHFCTEDFKAKEQTGPVCCPLCNSEQLELEDVDPQAEVKRYSDSPFSTLGAGKSSQGKWISKLAIVEEDAKLAQELEEGDSPLPDPACTPSLQMRLAVTT